MSLIGGSIFGIKDADSGEKQWNNVYNVESPAVSNPGISDRDIQQFEKYVDDNRGILSELKNKYDVSECRSTFEVLETCVRSAIENNNHALFADYYAEMIISRYNSDERPLYDFLQSESSGIFSRYSTDFKKIKILKSDTNNYWRNAEKLPDFDDANLEKAFYKNEYLESILKGSNTPSKDTAVQIGLMYGLSSKDVNEWLIRSGEAQLYELDIVDCIGIFYLDYYSERVRKESEASDDYTLELNAAKERVKHVKNVINTYITKLDQLSQKSSNLQDESAPGSPSKIVVKQDAKSGLVYGDSVIDYDRVAKKWNIHEIISDLYKTNQLSVNNNSIGVEDTISYDKTLTIHFEQMLLRDKQKEDEFLQNLDSNLAVFKQVQYAFYSNLISYMVDMGSFKKNLMFYIDESDYYKGNELTSKVNTIDRILDIQKNDRDQDYPNDKVTKTKNDYNRKKPIKRDAMLYAFSSAYYNSNYIERLFYNISDTNQTPGDIYNKLIGKKQPGSDTVNLRRFSKSEAARWAIASGHENDIGNLLITGGYWNYDMTNVTNMRLVLDKGKELDLFELFLLYAYMYRNHLVDKWVESGWEKDKKSKEIKRHKYMSALPMPLLITLVSRDIQFVIRYCKNCQTIFDSIYGNVINGTVFRVVQSNMEWHIEGDYPSEKRGIK